MLRLDFIITVTAVECEFLRDTLGKCFAIAKKQFDAFKVGWLLKRAAGKVVAAPYGAPLGADG